MGDAPRFRLRTGTPSWDRICSVDIDRVTDGLGAGSTLSGIVDGGSKIIMAAAATQKPARGKRTKQKNQTPKKKKKTKRKKTRTPNYIRLLYAHNLT